VAQAREVGLDGLVLSAEEVGAARKPRAQDDPRDPASGR
jgi:hypothetical protein